MSRLAKKPIVIPAGAKVNVKGGLVRVEGPNGTMERAFPSSAVTVSLSEDGKQVSVARTSRSREAGMLCGTAWSLIANMMTGVTTGYRKVLEIVGVGYTVKIEGKTLVFQLGFSEPCNVAVPDGITVETPTATRLVASGCDKQLVGEFAAEIRNLRPPEPYKGKGIRYDGELIKRKAGKAFAGGQG